MTAVKSSGWLITAMLACVTCLRVSPAYAVTDSDRVAVYKEFRAQFDARKYAEAQPLAERLVALTEEQYGAEDMALTNPLTNLATIHYKLGNFPAAIENYQRTLRILQAKSTIADKQQIRPLHGLGVSFMGAQDPESAVVALKRAADLSRNTDGLFNINQVEFIDALIDAYETSGRYVEAEKESLYALRVEEAAYGRNSIKLLGRLEKLAVWYEGARRYTSERNTYERALGILGRTAPENDLRRVDPLRGMRAPSGSRPSTASKARTTAARSIPVPPAHRCSPMEHSSAVAKVHWWPRSKSSTATRPSTSRCAAKC